MIEAALLLCLIGTVLAVFVPTFLRRVRTNKISEASELLRELSRRTAAYYEASWSPMQRHCLPPSAGPTPEAPTQSPEDVDFSSADISGHATWAALGFQPDRPVRFSYQYTPARDGCDLEAADEPLEIVFRARGDLDGDGVLSTFERRATVQSGTFAPADALLSHQRTE